MLPWHGCFLSSPGDEEEHEEALCAASKHACLSSFSQHGARSHRRQFTPHTICMFLRPGVCAYHLPEHGYVLNFTACRHASMEEGQALG